MCEALVPPNPSRNFRQGCQSFLLIACTPVRLAPPHPPTIPPSPSGQGAASRPSGQGAAKSCSKPSAYARCMHDARRSPCVPASCSSDSYCVAGLAALARSRRRSNNVDSRHPENVFLSCQATSTPRPTTTRSDPKRTLSNRGFGRKVCLQIMSAPCRDQPFTNRPYCAHGLLRTDDGHGTVRT